MRIADGVEMLEITSSLLGRTSTLNLTLLWDEEGAVLVDTGRPGQLEAIRQAMERAGVPLERLRAIIITHQDIDHIGSLPDILAAVPHKVEVLADAEEKPYIEGEKRLLKLTDQVIARMEQSLPPDLPETQRRAFLDTLRNPPKAPVDRVVRPGEELPFCGGLVVIGTPGHTPGHISLYHRPSRTLIAADALRVVDGQLVGPSEEMTLDMARARSSLKAFTAFDVATVICYHGGAYADEPNRRLAELAG